MREERTEKKKPKKKRKMEVKKVTEKWEIWDEEEKTVKSEEEVKKLVSKRFHESIYVFGKNTSERMFTRTL